MAIQYYDTSWPPLHVRSTIATVLEYIFWVKKLMEDFDIGSPHYVQLQILVISTTISFVQCMYQLV